ncbi:MAG: 3'-5' exonuclease [Reichenbachiella sp.]
MQNFKNVIFIDIETASSKSTFDELPESMQELWVKKAMLLSNEEEISAQELYFERAGIYSEFGKIICISLGFIHYEDGIPHARVKALKAENERELLTSFIDLLSKLDPEKIQLCAHNGKEFDFPYLSRRILINQLKLPYYLDLSGKKPWEIQHLDTMQMWKFGDWKSYTSLNLLAQVFEIPSPKDDIDGSDVNRVYYEENDLSRIANYCNRDVLTTIQVFLRMKGQEIIEEDRIELLEN